MPVRKKKEPLKKYVSRCISTRRKEHPKESQKRSVAACYSMGRTHWKPEKGKTKR